MILPTDEAGRRADTSARPRAGLRDRGDAIAEAFAHLNKGLEVVRALPDAHDRAERELERQTALGPSLMASKGFAAPEVQQAYARARELCQQIGETTRLGPVLWALWGLYLVRADLEVADELVTQLLRLAQHGEDPALPVPARRALGTHLHFLIGNEQEAETCVRQAIDIASRQRAKSLELRAATSLSRLLQGQGRREEGRRVLAEAYAWFTEGFATADLMDAKALLDALATGAQGS